MPEDESKSRWESLAEKAIGAPLGTLTHQTLDGLPIAPIATRRATDGPRPWRHGSAWRVAQRIDHPDPDQANRLALLDLEGGADALTLVSAGSPYARGYGLAADPAALGLALEGVELDLVATRLDAGVETLVAAQALAALIERRRWASAALDLDLGFDPIGAAARAGIDPDFAALPALLDLHTKAGLAGRPLLADGRAFHEAGAGAAQQLAGVLASAVAGLRRLESLGLTLDDARGKIALLLVADADASVSLATFHAARRLWARVEQAAGLAPRALRLHGETSWRAMSRDDPWVNMMRATAGIFAAGLGGADVVTALPFTLVQGLPDDGARRLARNAQRILIDESHLDAVDDPAAGSGGFETLTDNLCTRAWSLFQEIEAEGGIEASLAGGRLQTRLAETAAVRATEIATLRAGLVGTTRFPSLERARIGLFDIAPRPPADPGDRALPILRDAAPFEALRDRSDAMAERPKAFLATLGPPAAFGPWATYAANFLAVAGFATEVPTAANDIDTIGARFAADSARVAVICGSNADGVRYGEGTAGALRDAGATVVLMAGEAGDAEANLRKAGVTDFIHDGCDAPRILDAALRACAG